MLKNNYNLVFPETINLAVLGSAVHLANLGPQTTMTAAALTLNGSAVNSAADVEVELKIVDGDVLTTVFLNPGVTAGFTQTVVGDAIIPAGATISATVSVAATVAAGSGSITLSISNG